MEAGNYSRVTELLEHFEASAYFVAKAELFRAMARHRQKKYDEAIEFYDSFISDHAENMPLKDREYVKEYALFFRSRAAAKLDPNEQLYSSKEKLKELAKEAPFLTRNEFNL